MFNPKKPSIREDTKASYTKRYRQLQAKFTREVGAKELLDPDEVVANLIVQKPRNAMRTWRHYKAAAIYYIETFHPEYETAIEQLRAESSRGLKARGVTTSGAKRKTVPRASWEGIIKVLEHRGLRGHRHSKALLAVLKATLLTGLRPNEWCHSEEGVHDETGRDVLRVRNSKHSNGRANGEYREMFIDELNAVERETVQSALAYCAVHAEDEELQIRTALKNELTYAIRWGIDHKFLHEREDFIGITLYSFRHQFIADAKLTFTDPVLISSLVGHNSTKTAFEHYGRRRNGRNAIKVTPTPESVEAVQKVGLETYREFVASRRPGAFSPD